MSNQWCDTCGGLVDRIGLRPQGVRFCECRETIEKLRAELAAERERAEKLQADADARLGDPRDIPADTGHREADRLICRLVSDDLDFQDCTDAVVLIRRLIADSKGPDEFATWKDAAVDERMKRVAAETERDTLRAESERLLGAVQRAYGYLWHVNNEPGAPNQYAPEQAAYAARRELRELLTHEQRGEGINAARAAMKGE